MIDSVQVGGLNAGLEGLMAAGGPSVTSASGSAGGSQGAEDFRSTLEQSLQTQPAADASPNPTPKPASSPSAPASTAPKSTVQPLAAPVPLRTPATSSAPATQKPVVHPVAAPVPRKAPVILAAATPVTPKDEKVPASSATATAEKKKIVAANAAEVTAKQPEPEGEAAVVQAGSAAIEPVVPVPVVAVSFVPSAVTSAVGKAAGEVEAKPVARKVVAATGHAEAPKVLGTTGAESTAAGDRPVERSAANAAPEVPAVTPIGAHLSGTLAGGAESSLAVAVPSLGAISAPVHAAAPSSASAATGKTSMAPDPAQSAGTADWSGGLSDSRTLVSNANVLEVGLTGGAHGWLRVRAEMGQTGEVTASLVASNVGSAASLSHQLGAISDYLKSETVGVSSLVVTAPEKNSGVDVSTGSSQFAGSPGGGQPQQDGRERSGTGSLPMPGQQLGLDSNVVSGMAALAATYQGSGVPAAMLSGGSGGWVNVRV